MVSQSIEMNYHNIYGFQHQSIHAFKCSSELKKQVCVIENLNKSKK